MAKTADLIIADIDAHLKKSAAKYFSDFYVGITGDIEERLHGFHNVPKENHWFIYRNAISDDEARTVEKFYLEKGMKGGTGGGDSSTTIVYCYRISEITVE